MRNFPPRLLGSMDAVKLHRHTGERREAVSTLAASAAGGARTSC
jgi:hypothetical protein